MAHVWPSRVRETTTTVGTGSYALGGAATGYRTFASTLAGGSTVDYCVVLGASWEIGRGTYNAGFLARTAILGSSNAGAAVDWPAGTKDVFAIHIGFSDLDATGLSNLALLVGALGVTGTPSTGQFPQFTGAAQVQGLSAAAMRAALDLEVGVDLQAYDADLAAIAALTTTTYGRAFLAMANAGAAMTALGMLANAQSLVTSANFAAMRALLDLEVGTDFLSPAAIAAAYQPLDSDLTAIAALSTQAFGRGLLAYASEATFKAGVNLEAGVDFVPVASGTQMPVGYCGLMNYTALSNLLNGATTSGANVKSPLFNGGTPLEDAGAGQTGTWQNESGATLHGNDVMFGLMRRTA